MLVDGDAADGVRRETGRRGEPDVRSGADADDSVVVRGYRDAREIIAFWLRDGRVRAAMNVNVWDVNEQLRALVGRQIEPARLAAQDVPLDEL